LTGVIFSTAYPEIFILLCLAFAWFLMRLLYRHASAFENLGRWQLWTLKGLRFAVLFLMTVLLLSPVVKLKKKTKNKPVVLVLQDNSSSMLNHPDSLKIRSTLDSLKRRVASNLSGLADLKWYLFADSVQEGTAPDYKGNLSDYSDAIQSVAAQHAYEKPVAMLIVGDGIYNAGQNPVNTVRTLGYPVYSVIEGDTTVHSDIRISQVRANTTAFPGKAFPVEVEIAGNGLKSGQTRISITHDGKVVEQRIVPIAGSSVFRRESFRLKSEKPGLQHYQIQLSPVSGEQNTANNTRVLTVDVLNSQRKILILAGAPHPDIGALTEALESDPQFKVVVAPFGHFGDYSPEKFNLLIFYQVPESKDVGISDLKKFIDSRTSRWYFLGTQSSISAFNKLNGGMKIVSENKQLADVQMKVNPGFGLFHPDIRLNDWLGAQTPLVIPEGKVETEPFMETLFYQSGSGEEKPALIMGEQSGVKKAVFDGEGIWRWRISARSVDGDKALFNDWIVNTARYLALKRNEDQFNVHFNRMVQANEAVHFSATLFNAIYEPVHNSAVTLDLTNASGKLFHYVFTEDNDGYELNAGHLPPGSYHFSATAKVGADSLKESGDFEVMAARTEMLETRANQQIMTAVAQYSGGKVYFANQLDQLFPDLKKLLQSRSEQTEEVVMMDAIRYEFVLFLLIALLAVEWFLRRYWGSY